MSFEKSNSGTVIVMLEVPMFVSPSIVRVALEAAAAFETFPLKITVEAERVDAQFRVTVLL